MNDNVIILKEINAIVYAVFALAGFSDPGYAQIVKAVNAFWFSTIRPNPFLDIPGPLYGIGYIFITHTGFIDFIEYPKGFRGFVYQPTEQGGGIVGITEVKPKSGLNTGNLSDFLHRKSLFFPILKDCQRQ